MKKLALLTFALLAPAFARAGFSTDNLTATKSFTAPYGSTTPASQCTSNADRGKIFVDTAAPSGQQIYECEGTAGWKLQGGTGGGIVAIDTGTVNQLPLNRLATGIIPSSVVASSVAVTTIGTSQMNLGIDSSKVLRGDNVLDNGVRGMFSVQVGDSIQWDLKAKHTIFGTINDDRAIARISGEVVGLNPGVGSPYGDAYIWSSFLSGPTMVPVARYRSQISSGASTVDELTVGRMNNNGSSNAQYSFYSGGSTRSLVYGDLYGTDRIHANTALEATTFYGTGSNLSGLTSTQVGLGNVQNVDQTIASNLTSGLIPNARHDASSVTLRGQTPLVVSTNGVVVGNVNTLNLKPGTNTTMTAAMWVSSCDVTINAAASAAQDFNLADGTGTLSGSKVTGGTFGAVNGSALTNLTAANISGGILGNTVQVSSLAAVTTAGSYGSATISPTITFNAQGQVTSASSNTISISGSNVSGGTFGAVNGSALTHITAANIDAGSLGATVQVSSLAAVVAAGSYGSATVIPTITFNAQGQIIAASSNTASGSGDMILASTQTVTAAKNFTSSITASGPFVDSAGSHGSQVSGINGMQVLTSTSTGIAPLWQTIGVVVSTAGSTTVNGVNVCQMTAAAGTHLTNWSVMASQASATSTTMTVTVKYSDATTTAVTTGATSNSWIYGNSGALLRWSSSSGFIDVTAGSAKPVTQLTIASNGGGTGARGGTISADQVPL